MQELTQKYLKSILDYNPNTGSFTWKIKPRSRTNIGDVAGYVHKSTGYIKIKINKKSYPAHRLAWLYVHGEFPSEQIDHINHNRADNRIANLRAVSYQENNKNQSISKNNTSGTCGVVWHKHKNKWQAQIKINYKNIYLGYFTDLSEAIYARKQAEIDYNFHHNHGVTI